MKRRPDSLTIHLRKAVRKLDQVAHALCDEQIASHIAYVLTVSRGDKRQIRRLFRGDSTSSDDKSVELEGKLPPRERYRAVRQTTYGAELESLYEWTKRLRGSLRAFPRRCSTWAICLRLLLAT